MRQRIRWFFLVDGLWGITASLFLVTAGLSDRLLGGLLAAAGLVALGASHVVAYRRGRFPRFEWAAEGLAVGLAGTQLTDIHQITPLIYPPLFFRALYGSLRDTVGTLISYVGAYYAVAAVWPTLQGRRPIDQQELVPNMVGMLMVGVMTYVISITSLRHERAAARERTLARAGAALVAAADHQAVYAAALDAVRDLLVDVPVSRTGLSLQFDDEATIVAMEGRDAERGLGVRIQGQAVPAGYRLDGSVKQIAVDASRAELEAIFGFPLHPGTLTLTPLRVKERTLGVLAVESPNPLPTESADALAALASEVALALDLQRQAFYDALTQLANRALFTERIRQALARASQTGSTLAVLFIDLDDFKVINDSLGHAAGDQLLVDVARRLRQCAPVDATVARLGGDEFTVLLEDLADGTAAVALAERIAQQLAEPILVDGRPVVASASIGIALQTGADQTDGDLLQAADLALYAAKDAGKACSALFEPAMAARAVARLELETELRAALARREFEVHYQPVVDLEDGRVTELEALVRWRHPVRGLVLPDDFIPLAEESGVIVPIGQWVLETACRQARAAQLAAGDAPAPVICVNLSARQLAHPSLVEDVRRTLAETGLDPQLLRLEITESVAIADTRATHDTLWALRDLGVRLAIDDFGTGSAGLNYLRRFPVDTLKIDRSFVAELGRDARTHTMVRGMIALAKSMGLRVTGEGIETEQQSAALRAMACDLGQGHLFARPAPLEQAPPRLAVAAPEDGAQAA